MYSNSARHQSQDISPPISQIVLKNFVKICVMIKECPEDILIKLAIVLKISKSSWNIDCMNISVLQVSILLQEQTFVSVLHCMLWIKWIATTVNDWLIIWVFNATFSNISSIHVSWRPVLMVEEAGVPGKNHRSWASNWYLLYHLRLRVECTLICNLQSQLGNPTT